MAAAEAARRRGARRLAQRAGKSTFINAVTNAQAKVGAYAFTTTRPQLGVVSHKGREFVIADIPGLIEGAADGAGIGDRFLGHIERCRVLLHLVDANDEDVATSYRIVRDELEAYGAGLTDKPVIVALNKVDTLDDELIAALSAELAEESGKPVMALSGASGAGSRRYSTSCWKRSTIPNRAAMKEKTPAATGHRSERPNGRNRSIAGFARKAPFPFFLRHSRESGNPEHASADLSRISLSRE